MNELPRTDTPPPVPDQPPAPDTRAPIPRQVERDDDHADSPGSRDPDTPSRDEGVYDPFGAVLDHLTDTTRADIGQDPSDRPDHAEPVHQRDRPHTTDRAGDDHDGAGWDPIGQLALRTWDVDAWVNRGVGGSGLDTGTGLPDDGRGEPASAKDQQATVDAPAGGIDGQRPDQAEATAGTGPDGPPREPVVDVTTVDSAGRRHAVDARDTAAGADGQDADRVGAASRVGGVADATPRIGPGIAASTDAAATAQLDTRSPTSKSDSDDMRGQHLLDRALPADARRAGDTLASGETAEPVSTDTDQLPSPTPRADAMREKRPDHIPAQVWDRICDGVAFNEQRQPHYTERGGGNEISLNNDKRLDSYVPDDEIVSRKFTQLAEVHEATAVAYLREINYKYTPGKRIKDTPHNRAELPAHIGERINGALILEIPPQTSEVPDVILIEAKRLAITIRDTDGKVYKLPEKEDGSP